MRQSDDNSFVSSPFFGLPKSQSVIRLARSKTCHTSICSIAFVPLLPIRKSTGFTVLLRYSVSTGVPYLSKRNLYWQFVAVLHLKCCRLAWWIGWIGWCSTLSGPAGGQSAARVPNPLTATSTRTITSRSHCWLCFWFCCYLEKL